LAKTAPCPPFLRSLDIPALLKSWKKHYDGIAMKQLFNLTSVALSSSTVLSISHDNLGCVTNGKEDLALLYTG
jgi:hypothetical protein